MSTGQTISNGKIYYGKQLIIVTTHKNVRNYYNEKCTYNVNPHWNLLYALKIWDCLNFIQERSLIFFLLYEVTLQLILKDKGGKQNGLMVFVGFNLGVEILLNKREHQKRMHWNRGLRYLFIFCIEVSRELYAKPV